MSSRNWRTCAETALEETSEGPDRLHRAWVIARRTCMNDCEGPAAALWAQGTYAVDPGADPCDRRVSASAVGVCAALGTLGAGAAAGALLKPAGASVFGAAVGAFIAPLIWSGYRRLWPVFCFLCGCSQALVLWNGGISVLLSGAVFTLIGWLVPRKLSGRGVFDMVRAKGALEAALKAEGAMILAQLAQEGARPRRLDDLRPALADLAASQGADRLLAADALLQQAQTAGLVRLQKDKIFVWNEGSEAQYQVFGAAFEGDLMVEERAPWRDSDGQLVKGLARRTRQ